MHANKSQVRQIRNLLAVLSIAVVAAAGVSAWMLYHYNPSGRYLAEDILLAPQLIGTASMDKKGNIVFKGVQYISADNQELSVSQDSYNAFYNAIGKERSLQPIPEEASKAFASGKIPLLVLKIQRNGTVETFQEVQFAPQGDYYRVQLRVAGDEGDWVYYHRKGVKEEVEKIFSSKRQ